MIPVQRPLPELEMAVRAAEEAGHTVMEIYNGGFTASKKLDGSPLTEADIKSDAAIRELLRPAGHMILSEEGTDGPDRLGQEMLWIVDPLDGTAGFVDGNGEFTVMIALVRHGKPVLGVINWPAENVLFAAQRGAGAFRKANNTWERIRVSNRAVASDCRAVVSRNHLTERERKKFQRFGIGKFVQIGSSIKAAKIACGEAELCLTTTKRMKEWDTCASACVVKEAGGLMTDLSGSELTYNNESVFHTNGIIASNGRIHSTILGRL